MEHQYHLVRNTKYGYKILCGERAEQAGEVIRDVCQAREVTIIRGGRVSPDQVPMLVGAPP